MRFLVKVRFQERNGRDGGFGPTKSFKASVSKPNKAGSKLRKRNARIVSITTLKKLS